MFDAEVIQNIISIAKYVLSRKMQSYVQNLANGLKTPNEKSGCGCICGMKSLYNFIIQAEWRQSEMIDNENYQLLIAKIFKCVSLQPEYYTYMGGGNVINATIIPPSGGSNNYSYSQFPLEMTPPEGTTVLPLTDSDKQKLIGNTIIEVSREGIGMQTADNTRPDYYSFDSNTGEITINSAANGLEIFRIVYSALTFNNGSIVENNISGEEVSLGVNTDTPYTIPSGKILEKVVVTPSVLLTAFGIGNTSADKNIVPSVQLASGAGTLFSLNIYANGDTDVWFNGITGQTNITIYLL